MQAPITAVCSTAFLVQPSNIPFEMMTIMMIRNQKTPWTLGIAKFSSQAFYHRIETLSISMRIISRTLYSK